MENFIRDEICEPDHEGKEIVCQITNMYGENWIEDEEEEFPKKRYRIIIFAVDEVGKTVGITVTGFCPFFYVCIPDFMQKSWGKNHTVDFERYLKKRMKFFKWALKEVKMVEMKKLRALNMIKKKMSYRRDCLMTSSLEEIHF